MYRSSHRLDDTSGARLLALLRGEGAALDLDAEAHLRFRGGVRAGGPAPDVLLRLRASHDFAELRIEGAANGSPAVFAAGPVQKFLAALGLEPLDRVVSLDLSVAAAGARVHLRHSAAAGWNCEIQSEDEASLSAAARLLGLDDEQRAAAAAPRVGDGTDMRRIERRSRSDRRIARIDRRSPAAT